MSGNRKTNISVILAGKLAFAAIGVSAFAGQPAIATDFNAEKVMKDMTPQERASYLAGVIEGFAVARYMKDGKKAEGMNCIYAYFYEDKQNLRVIHEALDRYPTYTPGAVLNVLLKQKCGE